MCVIVYKPSTATVSRRILNKQFQYNPDGAGFMFAANGKLFIEKGYARFKTFYKEFRARERVFGGNFVIHFRKATVGVKSKVNCHPFRIGNNEVGFAHNGTYTEFSDAIKKSDSNLFGKEILTGLPADWYKNTGLKWLVQRFDKTSKLAIMDGTGYVTLINESGGIWKEGLWFSKDINEITTIIKYDHTNTTQYYSNSHKTLIQCDFCREWVRAVTHIHRFTLCADCTANWYKQKSKTYKS